MKRTIALGLLIMVITGCSAVRPTDARLIGTWQSNGDQTVAEMFRRDPRWANAPPERVQKLKDLFGQMRITYSASSITTEFRGEKEQLGYTVLDRGEDFVVIRIKGGLEDGHDVRIRFLENASAYWVHSFAIPDIEERFDRVTEPDGAANRSQPAAASSR